MERDHPTNKKNRERNDSGGREHHCHACCNLDQGDLAMIFEAIAAIKLANEAVGAIREMCSNVQSVGQMGSHLTKLADAKEEIKRKAENGDMEAFMALEDIKNQESEIKRTFIYQGRAGLWEDYQRFMRTRKELKEKERKRAEAKAMARKKAIKDGLTYGVVGISILGIVGGAVALLLYLISLKGK